MNKDKGQYVTSAFLKPLIRAVIPLQKQQQDDFTNLNELVSDEGGSKYAQK